MKISILLPTYNNERTIKECLKSIFAQKFPLEEYEVLFIDGGSTDKTLEIAKQFPVKILRNEKRNEEAARILGISSAKGEIICFIDADNVILGKDWLEKMYEPFKDKEIAFADTLYYSYRKKDRVGTRYQALIGGDDPLVMYLGYYSRYSYLTQDWTGYPKKSKDKGNYLKISLLNLEKVPAMGSNGFLVRNGVAKKFVKNTFIHSDFIYDLVNNKHNCFAKVKTGLIHNQPQFFPNKVRRVERRGTKEVQIKYNYGFTNKDLARVLLYSLLIIPILFDTAKGFFRKPDSAWFFHPIAVFGEIGIYSYYTIKYKIKNFFKR